METRTPWYASIVTRITVVFALLLCGVVALTGWFSWRASRTQVIEQAHTSMEHTIDLAILRLGMVEARITEDLDLLATSAATNAWCAASDRPDGPEFVAATIRFSNFIDPFIRSHVWYSQVRLLDAGPQGMEVVRSDRFDDRITPVPDSLMRPQATEDYYRSTMEMPPGERRFSTITVGDPPLLRVSAPLFTPVGQRAGVVALDVDMGLMFHELMNMPEGGRTITLSDIQGNVLMDSDTTGTKRTVGAPGKGKEGEVLASHRVLRFGPAHESYAISVSQPMSALLGNLQHERARLMRLLAVITLVTVGLTLLYALGMRSRLQALTRQMKQYAVGKQDDMPIGRRDEFGQMARGLRTMQVRIDERVHELEAARALAEASDRQRRDLLANMSHEVRTPLNAIIGMGGEVDTTRLTPADRDRMGIVRRSAERLKGLVDDLLMHARMGEGKLQVRYDSVDVRTLIMDIVHAHTAVASAKGLVITTALEGLPAANRTDPLRLHQVVDNLVGNAVRFTRSGEVRIAAEMAPEDSLRISVSDTGPGIPAEERERIFDRFERAIASDQEQGAGLGLAITKRVLDLLGGTIELRSELGSGSTFMVVLPGTPAVPTAPVMEETVSRRQFPPDTSGLRILYVEDVETNRMVVREWATKWGWELTLAIDAQEALSCCAHSRFDALLLDLGLGSGMNGTDLARELRTTGEHRHVPMIAVTAYAQDNADESLFRAGLNDRVTKPIDRAALLHAVAFWCDRSNEGTDEPDMEPLFAVYDHNADKVAKAVAAYRLEFMNRRLALRSAIQCRDAELLRDTRHALRPHFKLLGLDTALGPLEDLEIGPDQLPDPIEHAFRACERAFMRVLRRPAKAD